MVYSDHHSQGGLKASPNTCCSFCLPPRSFTTLNDFHVCRITVTWFLQLLPIDRVLSSTTMTLLLCVIIFWNFWSLCHLWSQRPTPTLFSVFMGIGTDIFCSFLLVSPIILDWTTLCQPTVFYALAHWQIQAIWDIWDSLDLMLSGKEFSENVSLSPTSNHIVFFPLSPTC